MKASAKKGNVTSLREAYDASPGSSYNVPRQSGDGARDGDQFYSLDAKVAALGLADAYAPQHDPALLIKSRQAGYSSARAPAHPQQYPPRWDAGPGGPPPHLPGVGVAENGARHPPYHPPAPHAPSNGHHAGYPAPGAAAAATGAAGGPEQPNSGPEYYPRPRPGAPPAARDARGFEPYFPGAQQQQQQQLPPPAANGYGRHSSSSGGGAGMYAPALDSCGFDQGPGTHRGGSGGVAGGADDARPGSSSSSVSRGSSGGARGFAPPVQQPLPAGYHHPAAPPMGRPVGGGYMAGPPPAYAGQQEQWPGHAPPPSAARGFSYQGAGPQGMPPMHPPPPPPPAAAAAGGSMQRAPLGPPMHPAGPTMGEDRGFAPVGPDMYAMPPPPAAAAPPAADQRGFAAYPMPPPPHYYGGHFDLRAAPPPPPPPPRVAQGLPPAAAGTEGPLGAGMAAAAAAAGGQPVQGMQGEVAGRGRGGPAFREGPQHLARPSSASSNGSGAAYSARGPHPGHYSPSGDTPAASSTVAAAAAAATAALAGGVAAPVRMQQAAAMANGDSAAAPQGVQHAPASAAAVGSVPRQNGAMQGPHGAVEAPQEAAASAAGTTESQQAPKAQDVKPEEPSGPRNEFAERLAQKAMANVLRAKSSLLAGEAAPSSSLAAPAAPAPAAATPAAPAAGAAAPSNGEGGEANGPFVKPAHPFGRPRLVLKPRSLPLPAEEGKPAAAGSASASASSSDDGKQQEATGPAAANGNSAAVGRPSLKLQPRTLPLPAAGSEEAARPTAAGSTWEHAKDASSRPKLNLLPRGSGSSEAPGAGAAPAAAAAGSGAAAKAPGGGSSVFGAARPREEVLKERGVDPLEVEGLAERQRLSEGSLARHSGSGSFKHGGSRGGSMLGSEGDDEWHTVGGGARRGRGSASGEPSLLSDVGGFRADPFFGGGSSGGGSSRPLPPAKGFASYEERGGSGNWQGHGRHSGSYGSPAVGGGYMERVAGGYAAEQEEEEGGVGVFARGLPTRHSLLL